MPDVIEDEIKRVLSGQNSQIDDDTCDYSLEQQNEAMEANGIKPAASSDYVPICQKTVSYIVAAVIFNENDDILMIQEAKPSCLGKWYLPAGRVEPNEHLIDATKREVLEETGLIVEPKSLIMVECASGSWFRFVVTGNIVGGILKTQDNSNEESLQAQWVSDVNTLPLRSSDILPLIQKGRDFIKKINGPWHSNVLPVTKPHYKLYLRLIICIKKKATNRLHVLMSELNSLHLPVCEINPSRNVHSTLRRFLVQIFGEAIPQHRPHGVLSVEFSGQFEGDGLCLTLLVSFRPPLEEVTISSKYIWHEVAPPLADAITSRLPRNMTISMNVIR